MPVELTPLGATPANSYLSAAEARALAATLPDLVAVLALSDDALGAGLLLAAIDIDTAMRYQGRKYDPSQALEFPRVASGPLVQSPILTTPSDVIYGSVLAGGEPSIIWDWDNVANAAVVPPAVKIASLYQVAWYQNKAYARRLESIQSGAAAHAVGTASETFLKPADLQATAGAGLGSRVARIMNKYLLRSGKLL